MGAPTMETLSCDLKGPNADMNKFWQERNNSEWTEVGKGEADKFAEKWGSSRQRVESCLNELKTNPDDRKCLEGIDMVATFGHCLKKPEKQVCGECGLMKIRNDHNHNDNYGDNYNNQCSFGIDHSPGQYNDRSGRPHPVCSLKRPGYRSVVHC